MPNDIDAIASQLPEMGPPLWSNDFYLLWHKYLDRDGSVRIVEQWDEEGEMMLPSISPTQVSPEYRKTNLKCERVIFSLPPGYVLDRRGAQEFVKHMKQAKEYLDRIPLL